MDETEYINVLNRYAKTNNNNLKDYNKNKDHFLNIGMYIICMVG